MAHQIISESTVESAALDWFEGMGYLVLHGPDIAPDEAAAGAKGQACHLNRSSRLRQTIRMV
jgi:hypothetical protein